jgi:predicted transcriptional regulator
MENSRFGFIAVIDGEFWNRLCQSNKQGNKISFFVRRNTVAPTQTKRLLFYVEKRMQILGAADFEGRTVGDAEELWDQFGAKSFFESVDEYKSFVGSNKKMTFIHFENFEEIADPKPKETVVSLLGSLVWFRPRYISQQTAELLEGKQGSAQ